jgi:hypothetical protein
LAALLTTFVIAALSGAGSGWLVSWIPQIESQFDDSQNFDHVCFDDDMASFNAKEEHDEVEMTDRLSVRRDEINSL